MQIFVKRSDLASNDPVRIVASYEDNVEVDPNTHGLDVVKLLLPRSAMEMTSPVSAPPPSNIKADPTNMDWVVGTGSIPRPEPPPTLAKDWRSKYRTQVIASEAEARIDSVFPEYSQRNSEIELIDYITKYGTDTAKWPDGAKKRKAEIDRCWGYVRAIRASTMAMGKADLPSDPTTDSRWPTRITPYQPQ